MLDRDRARDVKRSVDHFDKQRKICALLNFFKETGRRRELVFTDQATLYRGMHGACRLLCDGRSGWYLSLELARPGCGSSNPSRREGREGSSKGM